MLSSWKQPLLTCPVNWMLTVILRNSFFLEMASAGSAAFNPNDSRYKACCCHTKTFTIVVGILEIFAICFVLVAGKDLLLHEWRLLTCDNEGCCFQSYPLYSVEVLHIFLRYKRRSPNILFSFTNPFFRSRESHISLCRNIHICRSWTTLLPIPWITEPWIGQAAAGFPDWQSFMYCLLRLWHRHKLFLIRASTLLLISLT